MMRVTGHRLGWWGSLRYMGRTIGMLTILLASAVVAYSADPTLNDPRTMAFKAVEFSPPEPER